MKLVCPSCGAICAADAWGNDAEARQALRVISELPESVSRAALGYLALFRQPTGRGMRWSVALRHLSELNHLVREPFVQWEQRPARPNDSRYWGQAMGRLIEQPPRKLPLKSHGYLRSMVYDLADEADREAERKSIMAGHAAAKASNDMQPLPRISVDDMRLVREKKGL